MKKHISTILKLSALIFILSTNAVRADDEPPPFDEDAGDQAPINSFVFAGLIAGAGIGYMLLKKQQRPA
jgi:hypothetical protein